MLINARAVLVVALSVAACKHGSEGLHDVPASVEALRNSYHLAIEVTGVDGVASAVWVQLLPDEAIVDASRQCPVWDRQTVTLNDHPLELVRAGGLSLGVGPCSLARFYTTVTYEEWHDLPELQLRISDESGASTFLFENFIRTPVVVVDEPPSGNVRRGESFVLRFDPSTAILPAFTIMASGLAGANGMSWVSAHMDDVAIDHFRARFVVPEDARLGPTTLRFDTGNFPPTFGYRVGVRSCDDAISCGGRRVSGGGLTLPSNELDDDTVEVSLTVVE